MSRSFYKRVLEVELIRDHMRLQGRALGHSSYSLSSQMFPQTVPPLVTPPGGPHLSPCLAPPLSAACAARRENAGAKRHVGDQGLTKVSRVLFPIRITSLELKINRTDQT